MRARQARALQQDLDAALALHKQQQFDAAAQLYRRILKTAPGHFDALHLLGAIEGQNGRFSAALELLKRAVAIKPDSANAHNNLGNTYASLQRHAEALPCFERSLALKPDNPKALRNRGNTLRKLRRFDEALASIDRAIALQSDFTDAMASRGELLQEMHRYDDAADAFRAALAGGKDTETLHFALAALGAEPLPDGAPKDYVKGLFDQYAESFDRHLVEVLKYRTPELLVAALQRATPPPQADVVDLGCGTGLCGALLRPMARHLIGVDLSSGMLDRAKAAGHYDELVCAELVAFLDGARAPFDIAIAADVLIYLGDLAAVFAGIGRALRPGGLFAFSVETSTDVDYRLQPSRRYAHSRAYLERLARASGMATVSVEPAVLREDGAAEVNGLLVVMRRDGA